MLLISYDILFYKIHFTKRILTVNHFLCFKTLYNITEKAAKRNLCVPKSDLQKPHTGGGFKTSWIKHGKPRPVS